MICNNQDNIYRAKGDFPADISSTFPKSDEEKLNQYLADSKNKVAFNEKITQLFISEFEEKIQSILIVKESEFMKEVTDGVKLIIEDLYSCEVLGQKYMKEVLAKCEAVTKKQYYEKDQKKLSTAWNEYETTLQVVKKFALKNSKISPKNKDNFSFLKKFRKHCRYTDAFALHTCKDDKESSKMLEVSDDDSSVTHVICIECKKCYLSAQIALNCIHCKCEYYSSVLTKDECVDLLPATWEKYHCGVLVNDRMKCIRCRDIFYLNLKTGFLICRNPKCKLETKPLSIAWTCSICKNEFRSEAKIYNPLEFKLIKKAIQQTLLLKHKAKPIAVPCCKMSIYRQNFFHKKECRGDMFQGEFNKKLIVVCEKCHAMNYYDKYIWTCPKCEKRFKQQLDDDEEDPRAIVRSGTAMGGANSAKCYFDNITTSTDVNKAASTPGGKTISPNANAEGGSYSNYNYRTIATEGSEMELSNKKDADSYQSTDDTKICSYHTTMKLSKPRPKTLLEILEERKSGAKGNKAEITSDESQPDDFNIRNSLVKIPRTNLDTNDSYNLGSPQKNLNDDFEKEICYVKGNSMPSSKTSTKELKTQKQNIDEPEIETQTSIEEEKKNIAVPFSVQIQINNEQTKGKSSDNSLNAIFPEVSPQEIVCGKIKNFDIDEYKIIKLIGEGSYGKIYMAQNKKTYRKYAMKKIIAHSPKDVDCFKKEFELVSSVQHSNIMQIFGISINALDMTTYAIYVLMELAVSDWDEEVKSHLANKKPYSEEELLNILTQLCRGLAFLQQNSICHRDLKPQNVLVFEGNIYKVADFGEAKEVKISKQRNTLRGTELYMSPLLFEGLKASQEGVTHNTYKSDVFSLGYCLLYAATLNFNVIYDIRDNQDMNSVAVILNKHLKNRYTSKLINLILKMIEVDEKERYDFISLSKLLSSKK